MASILFLAPDDLGETVLATGALAHVLRAGDSVTVIAGAEALPLLRAAPGVTTRRALPQTAMEHAQLCAWLAGRRFDVVLDGRGGAFARLVRAGRRVALAPGAILRPRSEDWAEALGAERALAPKLWLDEAARDAARAIAPADAPLLVLAPGGVRAGKLWPWERFAAAARRLAGGPLQGARICVLGAARRDARITEAIVTSLDADGVTALDLCMQLDLLAAAALMERATLAIGNDNALIQIAAAAGAPTLALFGPTDERVRGPRGARVRTLRGQAFEEIGADPAAEDAAMAAISIDAVEQAALALLNAGGLS